jgi:hypothetical protein
MGQTSEFTASSLIARQAARQIHYDPATMNKFYFSGS